MEFKQVVGDRSTIRFFEPNIPVEPEKIQVILEAANRSSRSVNADFIKAIVTYRDDLDDETRERMKTPTSSAALDMAPVAIFWYGDMNYGEGGQERLKELVDLGALTSSHGWSHTYVDDVAWAQVVEPLTKDEAASSWMVSVECGQAIAQAYLAAVDEGLGAGLTGFQPAVVKDLLGVPDHWLPMWVMLVGYPAEDRRGGGQRPRRPLSNNFYIGRYGQPWEDIPGVRERLEREGMLQPPMDPVKRAAEVRQLAERFGLPL